MKKSNQSIVGISLVTINVVACGGEMPGPETATAGVLTLPITSASASDTAGTEGSTGENTGGEGETGGTTSADGESESNGNSTTSTTGGPVDTTTTTTGGYNPNDICAESTVMASELKGRPTDIIIAVDNSGSMTAELGFVQEGINDFVSALTESGVDAHVALLTGHDICVPPPLGSGGFCTLQDPDGDDNLPKYDHIEIEPQFGEPGYGVQSYDPLTLLMDYAWSWKSITREGSKKFVLVVSDEVAMEPYLLADGFHPMFSTIDPSYNDYVFTGIVGQHGFISDQGSEYCSVPGPQKDCCSIVPYKGTEYIKLAELTGGITTDICEGLWGGNFNAVFDVLTQEIVEEGGGIQCDIDIPEENGNGDIDYGDANVDYNDGNVTEMLTKVNDESECANVLGGKAWYYDDNEEPQKIHVCPAFCESVQGNEEGAFDVKLGCDGIIPT